MFIVLSWADSKAVGMGRALEEPEKGVWRMGAVYTNPDFRRKGFGTKMIATRLEEIKRRGGKKVLSSAQSSNKDSINRIESFGFEKDDKVVVRVGSQGYSKVLI